MIRRMGWFGLVFFAAATNSYGAGPNLVDCRLERLIDSSVFEESLSIDEYPEVRVEQDGSGELEAWIGSSRYSTHYGDTVEGLYGAGFQQVYRIRAKGSRAVITLRAFDGRSLNGDYIGTISYQTSSRARVRRIATLRCR